MKIIFHKKFQKFIKKLKDADFKSKIKEEVDWVIQNPQKGKLLEHPFRKYKIQRIRFFYQSQEIRIAYALNKNELVFLLISYRENFYKKLRKQI